MKHGVYYWCAKYTAQKRRGGENMDRYTPEQARKLRNISQVKMAALMGMAENTDVYKRQVS